MNPLKQLLATPVLTPELQKQFDGLTKGMDEDTIHAHTLKNFFLSNSTIGCTKGWEFNLMVSTINGGSAIRHEFSVKNRILFRATFELAQSLAVPDDLTNLNDYTETFIKVLPHFDVMGGDMTIQIVENYTLYLQQQGFIVASIMATTPLDKKFQPSNRTEKKKLGVVFANVKKVHVTFGIYLN